MKEEDARKKWCPMTNIIDIERGISNKPSQRPSDLYCITSDCMWWVEDSAPPITESIHGHCGLIK